MNVFISYGSSADQVTALRLQALGAVNGLVVYVPPAHTRRPAETPIDPEVAQKLREADLVLGVVGAGLSEACRQELHLSGKLSKVALVVADPALAPQLESDFGPTLVVIDPVHPERTESGIVRHLQAIDAAEDARKALLALGTLALGLLMFAPQE